MLARAWGQLFELLEQGRQPLLPHPARREICAQTRELCPALEVVRASRAKLGKRRFATGTPIEQAEHRSGARELAGRPLRGENQRALREGVELGERARLAIDAGTRAHPLDLEHGAERWVIA